MAFKVFIKEEKVFCKVSVKARSRADRKVQSQKQETIEFREVSPADAIRINLIDLTSTDEVLLKEDSELREKVLRKIRKAEARLFGEARAEVGKIEGAGITWEKLVERWKMEALFNEKVRETLNLSEKSSEGYLQAVEDHTDCWNRHPVSEITADDFEVLVMSMRKAGYANATIYNVKNAINCVYKWGMKNRILTRLHQSPTYGVEISRKTSRRPEILNLTQIKSLLSNANERSHPWYQIWKLILHTGLRSGEAYALKVGDVCREEKRIIIDLKYDFLTRRENQLKDHEWRQVPINAELEELLGELGVWEKGIEEYILPRIQAWKNGEAAQVLRAFCSQIDVPSICFHTLRACWATQLLRNNVSQAQVMVMGGWSDLETMMVYLRRAGVDIIGATDSLSFERKERPARIFKKLPMVAKLEEEELINEEIQENWEAAGRDKDQHSA